jgi:hypothetical protein
MARWVRAVRDVGARWNANPSISLALGSVRHGVILEADLRVAPWPDNIRAAVSAEENRRKAERPGRREANGSDGAQ